MSQYNQSIWDSFPNLKQQSSSSYCFKQSRFFEKLQSFHSAIRFMNFAFQREPNQIIKLKYLRELKHLKLRHIDYRNKRFNTGY